MKPKAATYMVCQPANTVSMSDATCNFETFSIQYLYMRTLSDSHQSTAVLETL